MIGEGEWKGRMYAINPNGTKRWSITTDEIFEETSPAIGPEHIYMCSVWGDLLAFGEGEKENEIDSIPGFTLPMVLVSIPIMMLYKRRGELFGS